MEILTLNNADPRTLRLIAEQLFEQSEQLKRHADRLENQARKSAAIPIKSSRAARLANAYLFSGMKPETAIALASHRAKIPETATRAALKSLDLQRKQRRRERIIARSRLLIETGLSLRQAAILLDLPKSTLADWLKPTGADARHDHADGAQFQPDPADQ